MIVSWKVFNTWHTGLAMVLSTMKNLWNTWQGSLGNPLKKRGIVLIGIHWKIPKISEKIAETKSFDNLAMGPGTIFGLSFEKKFLIFCFKSNFSCLLLLLEKRGLEGGLQLWTQSTRGKFQWTSLRGACVRSYVSNYWIKFTIQIQIQIQIYGGKFPWTNLKYVCVMSQMPSMMSTSTSTSRNVPKKIL